MKINKLFLSVSLLGIYGNLFAGQFIDLKRKPRIITLSEVNNIVRKHKRLQEKNKCFHALKVAYSESERKLKDTKMQLQETKMELIIAKRWNDDAKAGIVAGAFLGLFLYFNQYI
ncbi:hypothetical protein K9K77_00285 [Candidatus Babeliales bacterium]|nr:hypothetical protein [Candidatus Babeliales bacterium]